MLLSTDDRRQLIELARLGVQSAVRGQGTPLPPGGTGGVLAERRGCFVTLTRDERLRGCIGTFCPSEPLGATVLHMAGEACRDPRFVMDPITPAELEKLTIEVSVLSELKPTDDPLSLQVGTHGIYILRGRQAGCFLPEVATDMGWDAPTFLSQCCAHKAGLPADAWRRSDTRVFLFTSEKFCE